MDSIFMIISDNNFKQYFLRFTKYADKWESATELFICFCTSVFWKLSLMLISQN